jgi:fatty acid desaturase
MMMVLSALRPDASLPEFLVHRARSASVRRLSIDLALGVAGFAAALHWRPTAWLVVASLGMIFFAYGGWGISDRSRSIATMRDNRRSRALLEVLCFALAAAGVLATAALLYTVWAMALGTWIS